jgi:hypothetical protein
MSTPIPPETMTWLHQAARNGSSMAQTMLVVLERLNALEHLPAPEAAPAPEPPPATLVQQLACLIHAFASARRDRWPGNNATPTAIQAVRLVADWAENRHGFHVPFDLRTEADRAAAELEGRDG